MSKSDWGRSESLLTISQNCDINVFNMNWETHKKRLLKEPQFGKALEETRLEYEIARAFILARLKHKLTQKQLAAKLKTKQSVISRVENAQTMASLSFLKRFSALFGGKLKISFEGI